jgi:glycerol uptake facilitator-like aquaporin
MGEEPILLPRRLLAEALGTAILVATVVGSGIMAQRLAGGNQAIALLGNTIPTGAILVVIITIFGPISGAHFNPAVSLVFAARGEFPWREVIPYILVQCAAGEFTTTVAGIAINHVPAFIVAHIVGAFVALLLSAVLFPALKSKQNVTLATTREFITPGE